MAPRKKKKNLHDCDQFKSARDSFPKAAEDMCIHIVHEEKKECGTRTCCINCPHIMDNCTGCCTPARKKLETDMASHEETMERCATTTEAAIEVVAMEGQREENALTDQADREARIAEVHEVIGRIQGVNMLVKFGDVANLVWLKDVKEHKIYKDLPNLGTWDKFCEHIGLSRRKVDEDLQNLHILGEEFMATVATLRVGYRDLRKLRKLSGEGALLIEDNTLHIGDETISLDDKEELAAAIENVIEAKDAEIEEQATTLKTKDRLLESKENLLNKMEREISRLEKNVDITDLSPEEQDQIDIMSKIQMDFQKSIAAMRDINPETATTPVLRSRLFLYYFMSKIALEERLELSQVFDEALATEFEITEEELPPSEMMTKNLPLTRDLDGKVNEAPN